ncbi:TonB-dependent receptor [Hymenobacter sp. CRA2]|uniref:TonB-dependent receptor n=1 Tax=Hymenobacter sp. CRA2 TaxID=1955620 RepID=UPI00098EB6BD|nr:TonB-dependent receptor [Hymenobacter sp. CRA2]OON67873.1 TonB-dependent siderophore receptor [Hymenobacter sp. CRA2]
MKHLPYLGLTIGLSAFCAPVFAQQAAAIRGTVTTQDGSPAESVTVGLKGRPQGAITNSKGQFVIERVRDGQYTVVVSAVGLQTTEKQVTVSGGQAEPLDFVLAESAQQLREVVVSGARINKFARKQSEYVSKMPLNNLENPQVYATVGKELLTEQLVFSVDDAVRNAPGLQKMWDATGRAGDGGAYYNTRGFIVQSQLRNGLAGNVTSSIDAVNLEKLEVIKGPSATLFGSALTSYGGLVNRVTKKAYETFGGEVSYATGSFAFNRLSLDVNTPLGASKKVLFRLNAAGNYEDSWQNRGYQGFRKSVAIAPTLTYRPTDRLTINLDAELLRGRGVTGQILFPYGPLGVKSADQLPVDYRQSYWGEGLIQDSRSSNYFGQVNYQIAPGFTSSTNVTHSRSYSDGFGPYIYLSANSVMQVDQATKNSRSSLTEVQQLFNGDFLIGKLRNRVVLGLDFLRVDNNQYFFGPYSGPTLAFGLDKDAYRGYTGAFQQGLYDAGRIDFTYPVTTKFNNYSAFASDVLNLTKKLSVMAALRVDRYDNRGGNGGFSEVQPFAQTALSPKFGVVFQPVLNKVSVFANYQNSFRNPGAYRAYNPAVQPDSIEQRIAKLEQANQWEAGVKLDLLEGKLTTSVSYYDIRVTNLLRADPRPEAVIKQGQTQDGTQLAKGVELNVVANPVPGLNVVAGFAYNDSKLTKADESVNGLRPATAASPYLANLWLSYRLMDGRAKGLGAGFGGNYASDNKIINTSASEFVLPSYTVLNATLFYDQPKYRIGLKVDNLTDQHYWVGYSSISPQKVRSFTGSVAYKF